MKTMKAVRFEKYGSPSVLSVEELAVPSPKSGQALIELHASAINPSDVKNVASALSKASPCHAFLGRDFAGVVLAGEGWRGKEVWGSGAGFWRLARRHPRAIYPCGRGRATRRSLRIFPWRRLPLSGFPI